MIDFNELFQEVEKLSKERPQFSEQIPRSIREKMQEESQTTITLLKSVLSEVTQQKITEE